MIVVSYDVPSLFTNVPFDETIQLLSDKAFKHNWFNKRCNLNINKADLVRLLSLATKLQLLQFNCKLCEQVDGVGMGSPLGPLMAKAYLYAFLKRNWLKKTGLLRSTDDMLMIY